MTDSKSSLLETSLLDVVDVGGGNVEHKDQSHLLRQVKPERIPLTKYEIQDADDDDDDDENDADYDANEETCSEGDDQDEVMSSARTTGIVQRSLAGSTQSQTQAHAGTLTRSRKRSGVEEDHSVLDKDNEVKKIKVAPPKLSPIEEGKVIC